MPRKEERDKRTKNNIEAAKHSAGSVSKKRPKKPKKPKKQGLLPGSKLGILAVLVMMLIGIAFAVMLIVVNMLPPMIVLPLLILMIVIIAAVSFLLGRNSKAAKTVGVVLMLFFFFAYGMMTSYLTSTYAMFSEISENNGNNAASSHSKVDVSKEPFNIYITGIDQWSTEKGMDLERSDVNMIVTVNPETHKILLTSIPRDTYVKLHTAQQMDKLTHTGVYGVDETINTVQDWLGLDLNYYVKMNFTAVVAIVNAMGGIDVESPMEFNPVKMPDWTVKKGMNHMDGRQALAFARERKAFEEGDAKRVDNQQLVVKAMLAKMMSSTTLLTKYGSIMSAASDNMSTNMPVSDIEKLIKLQIANFGGWEIDSQTLKGEYDQDYVASLTQSQKFSVYKATQKDVETILEKINSTLYPTSKEKGEALEKWNKKAVDNIIHNQDD